MYGKILLQPKEYDEQKKNIFELLESFDCEGEDVDFKPFFIRWREIADRLKKGQTLVDADPLTVSPARQNMAVSLYYFLMELLGLYDRLLKSLAIKHNKLSSYNSMQRIVIDTLK